MTVDQTLNELLENFCSSVGGIEVISITTYDGVPLSSCALSKVDLVSLSIFGSIIATSSGNVVDALRLGKYHTTIVNAMEGKIVMTGGMDYCVIFLLKASGNLGIALLRLKDLLKKLDDLFSK